MPINLPDEVQTIIQTLENNGYEAYAVGGCVRDSLMGLNPKDWDICTCALPEQTMKCFSGQHIVKTGLKHGTVTVMMNQKPIEITTYRVEGKYRDNRHPDKVKFVNVLKRDLARRDFTVNAMAYNLKTGIVDYYSGREDLLAHKIKSVGNPNKRFAEDALRIMRALRFASVLGFTIDSKTSEAMLDNKGLLKNIAQERIAEEINGIILGDNVSTVLTNHLPILTEIIPEFTKAIGFEQNNPYHCYDVMTHILNSVDAAPKDLVIRLALLFHDIGKPDCYTESGDGVGHFYGHPKLSSDMAGEILKRLKYDNATIRAVTQLVEYHDSEICGRVHVKRWLNKIGQERLKQLIEVKKADSLAHSDFLREERQNVLEGLALLIEEITAHQQCFSSKDLAVRGSDLLAAGMPAGIEIGAALDRLLNMVIDEEAENDKEVLLEEVRKMGYLT